MQAGGAARRTREGRVLAASTCLIVAMLAAPASAQVLLLPVERDGVVADTSAVADAAATSGTTLRSHEAARAALVATHGEDPPEVSESDLARWVASSRQAVRSLARADYDSARAALAQAEAVTDRALAELNREATRARQVLDTCLYLVRSLEETGQHGRAVEQGYACRRLVPRGQPTLTQHPPEVRGILDEVDRALADMPGARLRVVSEPAGCAVRLNGLDFGATPLLTEDLRPGEYRVQVECGDRRGRIHRVDLTRAGAELQVDAVTEGVLGTSPLRIIARELDPALVAQVARLGRIAGAREVWLVEESGRGRARTYTLHRIDTASDAELAVVRTEAASLPLALASLRQGRSHDWTTDRALESAAPPEAGPVSTTTTTATATGSPGSTPATTTQEPPPRISDAQLGVHELPPEPVAEPEPEPEPVQVSAPPPSPPAAHGDHTVENVVGALALALGAGAYGTSYGVWEARRGFHGQRLAIAEPTDVDYLLRQSAWLDAQVPVWTVSGVGAALWTVAVPLTFGPDHEVPWWSWVLGGLGLAGVGAGVAIAVTATPCASTVELDAPCVDAGAQLDLGWLIAAQAAPFLAFPITHLARAAGAGPDASASVALGPGRLVMEMGGTF